MVCCRRAILFAVIIAPLEFTLFTPTVSRYCVRVYVCFADFDATRKPVSVFCFCLPSYCLSYIIVV